MNWLRKRLAHWLLADLEGRMLDLEGRMLDVERHFVTKRDGSTGEITETLADVPLKDRKERNFRLKGMSPFQKRAWLEKTDGGRLVG